MANAAPETRTEARSLEVRRTINAPRERVFQAFTKPEELKRWSAPGPLTVAIAEVDLKVGGKFRIAMERPDGGRHIATGEYREITPPRRLVYTWSWEDKSVKDSVITIELEPRGGSTEVILRHELLPNQKEADQHTSGWTACLEKLAGLFA